MYPTTRQQLKLLLFVSTLFVVCSIVTFNSFDGSIWNLGFIKNTHMYQQLKNTDDLITPSPSNHTSKPVDQTTNMTNNSMMSGAKHGRPCTLSIYREYYENMHYFPGVGKWIQLNRNKHKYALDVCYNHGNVLSQNYMNQCLLKGNVSSILVMGDSNASKFYNTLLSLLSKHLNTKCANVAQENVKAKGYIPDKSYFKERLNTTILKNLQVSRRGCHSCMSKRSICKSNTHLINMEYLEMYHLQSKDLFLVLPNQTYSAQEFLFKFYLENHYPDIILIMVPFNHLKVLPQHQVRTMFESFHKMVRSVLPAKTKAFYVPTAAEFDEKKKNHSEVYKRYEGRKATDQINMMNHMMYEVLESDLLEKGSTYGFPDLIKMSSTQLQWSVDGIHYTPDWYEVTMSMFLETFCNSVLKEQF